MTSIRNEPITDRSAWRGADLLDERSARAVAAGAEHELAANDGRRDVRRRICDSVVAPEERAGVGVDSDEAATKKLYADANSTDFCERR